MKTNIVADVSLPIPYLAKFWCSNYGPKCCQLIKLEDSLKCDISRKKWMMKFIFGMQINIENLLQVDTIILDVWCPGMPKVPKIRSLHIVAMPPEKHGGEVVFLPANKHKSLLQVDSITLGLRSQACPK